MLVLPLVALVVLLHPLVVLVCPLVVFVCPLVVLVSPFVCPFVVSVYPLVVSICSPVVFVVLSFGLFISDPAETTLQSSIKSSPKLTEIKDNKNINAHYFQKKKNSNSFFKESCLS